MWKSQKTVSGLCTFIKKNIQQDQIQILVKNDRKINESFFKIMVINN